MGMQLAIGTDEMGMGICIELNCSGAGHLDGYGIMEMSIEMSHGGWA